MSDFLWGVAFAGVVTGTAGWLCGQPGDARADALMIAGVLLIMGAGLVAMSTAAVRWIADRYEVRRRTR